MTAAAQRNFFQDGAVTAAAEGFRFPPGERLPLLLLRLPFFFFVPFLLDGEGARDCRCRGVPPGLAEAAGLTHDPFPAGCSNPHSAPLVHLCFVQNRHTGFFCPELGAAGDFERVSGLL